MGSRARRRQRKHHHRGARYLRLPNGWPSRLQSGPGRVDPATPMMPGQGATIISRAAWLAPLKHFIEMLDRRVLRRESLKGWFAVDDDIAERPPVSAHHELPIPPPTDPSATARAANRPQRALPGNRCTSDRHGDNSPASATHAFRQVRLCVKQKRDAGPGRNRDPAYNGHYAARNSESEFVSSAHGTTRKGVPTCSKRSARVEGGGSAGPSVSRTSRATRSGSVNAMRSAGMA